MNNRFPNILIVSISFSNPNQNPPKTFYGKRTGVCFYGLKLEDGDYRLNGEMVTKTSECFSA
jgi:hypothetical protein